MTDYPIDLTKDIRQEIWNAVRLFSGKNYGLNPQAIIIHPLTCYKLMQSLVMDGVMIQGEIYPPMFRGINVMRSDDVNENIVRAIYPNPR